MNYATFVHSVETPGELQVSLNSFLGAWYEWLNVVPISMKCSIKWKCTMDFMFCH
jgi:hypothetical protein